ncbi:MAG: bifunctional oligoribonuclease/PAP phosphatase NrnA [Elusimicrobia bacterium]|nr:bifunctional oligoribonuclease/PAP phosphatase NrnA [Elusimicrobiota bacterium]
MKNKKVLTLQNSSKQKVLNAISAIIKESRTFFVAGHTKPDGDALGSGLALSSMLRRMGKKVTHCSIDPVPSDMMFIPQANKIKITNKVKDTFDCAIILESINFDRMGDIISPEQAKKIINIDHHLAHNNFGDVNYIVPTSSSVSELVYDVFKNLKIAPTKQEAENLYIGIVTDTGRFQQLNTTANSHLVTAELLNYGVNSNNLCKKLFSTLELPKIKLYGLALSNIKTAFNNKFIYTKITKEMFDKTGSSYTDTDGIINYCIAVPTAVVGCILKQETPNTVKVSFRSIEKFNILDAIKGFDGGGHKNAAGCTIHADMDTAEKQILKAFAKKLK